MKPQTMPTETGIYWLRYGRNLVVAEVLQCGQTLKYSVLNQTVLDRVIEGLGTWYKIHDPVEHCDGDLTFEDAIKIATDIQDSMYDDSGCELSTCEGARIVVESLEKRSKPRATTGVDLIAAEQQKLVATEGLADAAYCYLRTMYHDLVFDGQFVPKLKEAPVVVPFPWDQAWGMPTADRRQNLAKAGAFIAAELDRIGKLEKSNAE